MTTVPRSSVRSVSLRIALWTLRLRTQQAPAAPERRARGASPTSCCRRSAFEPRRAEPAIIDGYPTLPGPVGHNSAVIFVGAAIRACAVGAVIAASVLLAGCVSTVSGTAVRAQHAAPIDVP